MKCSFYDYYKCEGHIIEKYYITPCEYWDWPRIFVCKYHQNKEITWQDALNTRSNVHTNDGKMTHTKELSSLQILEFWIGNAEEIIFCSVCNGVGGIKDSSVILGLRPCTVCNCTGRKINI